MKRFILFALLLFATVSIQACVNSPPQFTDLNNVFISADFVDVSVQITPAIASEVQLTIVELSTPVTVIVMSIVTDVSLNYFWEKPDKALINRQNVMERFMGPGDKLSLNENNLYIGLTETLHSNYKPFIGPGLI